MGSFFFSTTSGAMRRVLAQTADDAFDCSAVGRQKTIQLGKEQRRGGRNTLLRRSAAAGERRRSAPARSIAQVHSDGGVVT